MEERLRRNQDENNNNISEDTAMERAKQQVDQEEKKEKENLKLQFPRMCGPIPPEPYSSTLYCVPKSENISEMSNGFTKRDHERVYKSPFVVPTHSRFEPLTADLQAMRKFETKAINDQLNHEQHLRQLEAENADYAEKMKKWSINNRYEKLVARAEFTDAEKNLLKEVNDKRASIYRSDYAPFRFQEADDCPPNQFYNSLDYTANLNKAMDEADPYYLESHQQSKLPRDLNQLQDRWSKSKAHKQYNASTRSSKTADLRDNIHSGKKIVKESPMNASRLYYEP
jgi:hypothetical protein